uniref:Uncharacterized protein n=1 Tax=Vespula pensylvanica TaxID=30213 RepID=A0A834P490_VESPE|nr:hypothetical protein H0235_007186 [Vespula pensylvanica]
MTADREISEAFIRLRPSSHVFGHPTAIGNDRDKFQFVYDRDHDRALAVSSKDAGCFLAWTDYWNMQIYAPSNVTGKGINGFPFESSAPKMVPCFIFYPTRTKNHREPIGKVICDRDFQLRRSPSGTNPRFMENYLLFGKITMLICNARCITLISSVVKQRYWEGGRRD